MGSLKYENWLGLSPKLWITSLVILGLLEILKKLKQI